MRVSILTTFTEFFDSPLKQSILGRAITEKHLSVTPYDLRHFTTDKHRTTDDRPYGGGPGMVMKIEPLYAALQKILELASPETRVGRDDGIKVLLTSAKGIRFTQQLAGSWAQLEHLVIICGHYEGVDDRVAEHLVDAEVRIGEFVLTGGEPAALVMIDAVARLLPGVLGNDSSVLSESHTVPGQLEHPHYTRPEEFLGWRVPEVLLGGNHAQIDTWREHQQTSDTE